MEETITPDGKPYKIQYTNPHERTFEIEKLKERFDIFNQDEIRKKIMSDICRTNKLSQGQSEENRYVYDK